MRWARKKTSGEVYIRMLRRRQGRWCYLMKERSSSQGKFKWRRQQVKLIVGDWNIKEDSDRPTGVWIRHPPIIQVSVSEIPWQASHQPSAWPSVTNPQVYLLPGSAAHVFVCFWFFCLSICLILHYMPTKTCVCVFVIIKSLASMMINSDSSARWN